MPDWKGEITRRLAPLRLAQVREAEIVEELAQHLEDRYQEMISGGATEGEAWRVALEELSDENLLARGLRRVEQEVKEEPVVPRGGGGNKHLAGIWQDVRYALRILARSPGFVSFAVLTLALGIGANTVVFSLINTAVLHALPYPQSNRLVLIYRVFGNSPGLMSVPDFGDIERQARVFESMALWHSDPEATLTVTGPPTTVNSVRVSPDLFKVLGAAPLLGRTFLSRESAPSNDQVLILSYSFWRERFGGDPAVLDKTVVLGGEPRRIVGVMGPGFAFPDRFVDIWAPEPSSSYGSESMRNAMNCGAIGRLRAGVKLREAQAEMDGVVKRLGKAYPSWKGAGLRVVSLQEETAGPVEKALLVLLGAVGVVLLIACANVANLVLARNARREREFAVRAVLGATRSQMMRPLLAESLLVALLGGCVSVALAFAVIQAMRATAPWNIPRLDEVSIDGWVLGFTFLLSILTGVVSGVMPAFRATRTDLVASLKEGGSASRLSPGVGRPRHLPRLLAVAQVALAVLLVWAAGLLLRSFSSLMRVSLGFEPRNLLTAQLPETPGMSPGEKRTDCCQQLLDEVRMLPGVQSAALASGVPLGDRPGRAVFSMGRSSGTQPGKNLWQAFQEDLLAGRQAEFQVVTPDYFATMRIPILIGRSFTEQDRDGSPGVIIINQAMARRFWPGQNPVGRRVDLNVGVCLCEIIGVAGDARDARLETEPRPEIYRPRLQEHSGNVLLVRTGITASALASAIAHRTGPHRADAGLARLRSMQDVISDSLIGPRLHAGLVSLFAGLALLLAAVGTFGVVATSVNQRTHEIGVRLALGAQPYDVLRLVLREGTAIGLVGISLGLLGTFALSGLVSRFLYGVASDDPVTLLSVSTLMALTALLACCIPARRAMRVDPLTMLRYE
jgi:putative ABC transport system permease protein